MFVQMVLWYHGGAFLGAFQREGSEEGEPRQLCSNGADRDVSLLLSVT